MYFGSNIIYAREIILEIITTYFGKKFFLIFYKLIYDSNNVIIFVAKIGLTVSLRLKSC